MNASLDHTKPDRESPRQALSATVHSTLNLWQCTHFD